MSSVWLWCIINHVVAVCVIGDDPLMQRMQELKERGDRFGLRILKVYECRDLPSWVTQSV